MNKIFSVSGVLLAVVSLCGCYQTVVDSGAYSEEEKAWIQTIRENYPGYTPPPLLPGAVANSTQETESAVIKDNLAPAPDPVADNSAAKPEALPQSGQEEVPNDPEVESLNPAENEKAASVPEAKDDKAAAPEVKADAKADDKAAAPEVKADAKADVKAAAPEVKAEVKADAPAKEKAAAVSEPSEPTSSDVYVVKSGDTLGKIAQRAYGSARHTGVIVKANSDIIKNPNFLRPGMRLIIPKL